MTLLDRVLLYTTAIIIFVGVSCLLPGCTVFYPVVPDNATTNELCGLACKNMERLDYGCWRGSPGEDYVLGTPDDASCTDLCIYIHSQGLPFHEKCLAAAGTVVEMDACYE